MYILCAYAFCVLIFAFCVLIFALCVLILAVIFTGGGGGGCQGQQGVAQYQLLMLSPNLLIPHTNIIFWNENMMPCCANIILRCKYHSKFCNFLFGVIEVWSISSFGLNMKSWYWATTRWPSPTHPTPSEYHCEYQYAQSEYQYAKNRRTGFWHSKKLTAQSWFSATCPFSSDNRSKRISSTPWDPLPLFNLYSLLSIRLRLRVFFLKSIRVFLRKFSNTGFLVLKKFKDHSKYKFALKLIQLSTLSYFD